jgi:hypothetical protein
MHVHLPKPLHGWRAFLGEVGIIVLGVLIALGVEQLASAMHDRSSAADARNSIRDEIENNLGILALRSSTEQCMQNRLREIATFLDATGFGSKPRPLNWIGAPYDPLAGHTVFQSAQSAGKFFLLSSAEQQQVASMYVDFDDFNEATTREWYDWAQLRRLANSHAPLTAVDIDRLRAAVQDARAADWFVRIDSAHVSDRARAYGIATVKKFSDAYQLASVCLPSDMPYATAAMKASTARGMPFPE